MFRAKRYVNTGFFIFAIFSAFLLSGCFMMGGMMCHGSRGQHNAHATGQAEKQPMPDSTQSNQKMKKQATYYTCPMHPQIHEAKPGSCPICGMNLVPEESK